MPDLRGVDVDQGSFATLPRMPQPAVRPAPRPRHRWSPRPDRGSLLLGRRQAPWSSEALIRSTRLPTSRCGRRNIALLKTGPTAVARPRPASAAARLRQDQPASAKPACAGRRQCRPVASRAGGDAGCPPCVRQSERPGRPHQLSRNGASSSPPGVAAAAQDADLVHFGFRGQFAAADVRRAGPGEAPPDR